MAVVIVFSATVFAAMQTAGLKNETVGVMMPGTTPTNTNTSTPTQTQTPFPEYDLRISQSTSPFPLSFGFPLTYTVVVSNFPTALGGVACPNIRFDFPSGTGFMFNSAIGTNGYIPQVDSAGVTFTGGCVSSQGGVTGTATLKVVIRPGSGTLTSLGTNVVVDPENSWPESNETNNTGQTIQTTIVLESCRCITGTLTYANAALPPKYIGNAAVASTFGLPSVFTETADTGVYAINGFGSGNYTIGVTKTTGQNGISSNDAARVAQHVAGVLSFTTNVQKISADASNNGVVSSNDAALIAQYVAGVTPLPPSNLTGKWRFFAFNPTFPIGASPTTRSYTDPFGTMWGQDFTGILIGEVTGNWIPL